MSEQERVDLINACKKVMQYIEQVPGGCSYWVDEEQRNHIADLGYVLSFLDDCIYFHGGEGQGYLHKEGEKLNEVNR